MMVRKTSPFVAAALMALLAGIAVAGSSAGAVDTTFGVDGVARASHGPWVRAAAVQADGKILVASSLDGTGGWLVRRYTTAGALDVDFGTSGEATPFGTIANQGGIGDMILDSTGRILATGAALVDVLVETGKGKKKTWVIEQQMHAVVIRLTSVGALDSTFGDGGIALLDGAGLNSPGARTLALQSDGRIVVVGQGVQSSGSRKKKKGGAPLPANDVIFVTRLETNGLLDTSFATDGYATKDLGIAIAVAIQSDDAIVVGSRVSDDLGDGAWALHRYDADGALDSGFGTLVSPESGIYYSLNKIVIDGIDRILVSGFANDAGDMDGVVVRYGSDGSLDTGFGSSGIAHADIAIRNEGSGGLAIQSDGSIVMAGTITTEYASGPPNFESYIVRFTSGGAIDTGFGASGYAEAFPLSEPNFAWELALTPEGDIVVAGMIEDVLDEAGREMFVARWCGQ